MPISQKKANCSEVEEEEYEDYEEMEIEEVEDDDYEEAFEEEEEVVEQKEEDVEEEEIEPSEEDEEEEEIEPSEEDEEEIEQIEEEEEEIEQKDEGKSKLVEVEKVEEEESVQESAMEEDKTVNRKQLSESDVEQNEEEEEEIEPSEEEEEEIEQIEEEEEEIEQKEGEMEDGKKSVEVEKVEGEESVQESLMEEDKTVNRKQSSESDVEQNEEEEEEEIEPSEEDEEEIEQNEKELDDVKKVVEVEKLEEEEEESVQESAREEDNTVNRKQSDRVLFTPPAGFHPLLQSVNDLEKLHCALSKFLFEWNSFNRSLGSITSAMDEHASSLTEQKKDDFPNQEKKKEKRNCVEVFCEEMNGKALRQYIESNIKDIHKLRHEIPEALRQLPNPEKLVLDAIGKFYTQGRKACDNNAQLGLHRRASILLLEFFILSGRPTGDSSVRVEANHGAILWWKRIFNENVETASVDDCLALVLFLSCFGISMVFASRDLCVLLLKSDLRKKINVLRKSSILVQKIPGIVKDLIRGEMYYEAAELSCLFELTDNFPPLPLLSSLVARVIQAAKMKREKSPTFPNLVRQADSWELTSLRSVVKFLEYHKFGADSLDSVNIHKRISELENHIDGDAKVLLNNIRKRKVRNHVTARSKSRARSKKSFPSTPKTPQNPPSQMIQNNPEKELPSHPQLPENSALSAAVWERRTYFEPPASYRSSGMESPSHMIQKKPEMDIPSHLFRDPKVENSAVSVAGWGRRAYLESPVSYGSSAMEYSSAQQFYHRHALGYGNGGGGGFPGRDLYKFADTVEAQLSKSRRSSNTSPGGAKFGHY